MEELKIFGGDLPQALLNTVAIAEMCELELPKDQNHLPAFLRDCYYPDPRGDVSGAELQQEYAGWCALNGAEPMSWQRQVVPFLKATAKLKHGKGRSGKVWTGLRKIDPTLPTPEHAAKWPF